MNAEGSRNDVAPIGPYRIGLLRPGAKRDCRIDTGKEKIGDEVYVREMYVERDTNCVMRKEKEKRRR
jgi:hypothetical protein